MWTVSIILFYQKSYLKLQPDWLLCHYPNENEYVDLFYAITQCHGWIKSEADSVVVRLEPLQQPTRRKAQEQLCKRLNALNTYIPTGKILRIEVGPSPILKESRHI